MKSNHLLAAALAAFALSAGAQTNLKPGLWEINQKMQTSSGQQERGMAQMEQQMAKMPPEQRKMMEDAMKKQGVQMGPGAPGGGMVMKVCMTREMTERNEFGGQRGDCKTTQQTRSGNTMKLAYSCTNPASSGEGQITFAGAEAYTMKMMVNSTVQGKPEKVTMDGSGKWLGADCGAVKPVQLPRK